MSNAFPPTLVPGDISTNAQCAADLGNVYSSKNVVYQVFQTNSLAISKAGGKILQRLYTAGVPTNIVQECQTANSYDIAGIVPIVNGLTAATAIPAGSYIMAQIRGPGLVQCNTTAVGPTCLFAASGTTGGAASIDSTIGLFGAILGQITATAVATAANNTLTCIIELIDG